LKDGVLDTNVIIHLYSTGHESLLFSRFDQLYAHASIVDVELAHHASAQVIQKFGSDVSAGRVTVLGDRELQAMGILSLFEWHYSFEDLIYSGPGDKGEAKSISLAHTPA